MTGRDQAERHGAERERLLLHGLACQWEVAAAVLPRRYRLLLTRPFFALHDGRRLWGYWSRDRRQISLNRDLLLNHPWDAVCEVLVHELAHQLADCLAPLDPPHGPAFLKACALLGANPRASGTLALLDQRVRRSCDGTEDRIVLRIRKLLALAQSPNGFEAEAAMAKAHHLMATYHVDRLRSAPSDTCESIFVGRPCLRVKREDYALAGLICDFYFVQGIWVPAFVSDKGRMGKVLEVSGRPANLQLAAHAHDFVSRYIERQWVQFAAVNRHGGGCRTDFAVGIIEGFAAKMQEKAAAALHPSDLALTRVKDAAVSDHVRRRHPRLRLIRSGRRHWNHEAMAAGQAAGRRLVIHQPVSHCGVSPALLPE